MTVNLMLTPPAVFIIVLIATILLSSLLSHLSFKSKKGEESSAESYSCGEEVPTHLIQPDYGQFFPFAFFFTILHVVTLIVTTVPMETMGSFSIAVIYIAGAATALFVLFRRDR